MESEVITIGGILLFANLFSISFAIYSHFRKPQEKNVVSIAVLDQTISALKETVSGQIISIEKSMQHLEDNHLHTIQTLSENIKQNGTYINCLSKDVGELKGIIKSLK